MMEKDTQSEAAIVHMGQNVRIAREVMNKTQMDLAEMSGYNQDKISKLERQAVLEDEVMYRLSDVLGVSFEFIKSAPMKSIVRNFSFDQATVTNTNTGAEQSGDVVNQIQGKGIDNQENIYNYNYPVDKVVGLYDKMMEAKDKNIELLIRQNELLESLLRKFDK